MAGTGKSIARTIARRFADKEGLVASFFFQAGEELRGDARALFTTLAHQLTDVIPGLRPSICRAIEKDSKISERIQGVNGKILSLNLYRISSADCSNPRY